MTSSSRHPGKSQSPTESNLSFSVYNHKRRRLPIMWHFRHTPPRKAHLAAQPAQTPNNLQHLGRRWTYGCEMSTLNLPKPVNTYAGEDELRQKQPNGTTANGLIGDGPGESNGNVGEDEDMGEYRPPKPSDKLKVGMIFPPREIRSELSLPIIWHLPLTRICSNHRQDRQCRLSVSYTTTTRRKDQGPTKD